jgi:two-component system, NtrC family, response regulator AtoC
MTSELSEWAERIGGGAQVLQVLGQLLPETAVFAVDADRNVVFWSPGAEQLLGFGQEEVLGRHCRNANRCHQCLVGCGIAERGRVHDAPLTLYRSTGEPVRLRKTAQAFFDDDGGFAGGIEVLVPDTGSAAAPDPPTEARNAVIFHGLASSDPVMHQVFETCRNVAETDANTLIRGESGTGKELVAHALHLESVRRDKPFVAVNCASLTPSLMESELFGHVRGAFTGAVQDRVGIFKQADGGTLFLDEIAELPLDMQAKLLRVLEQREVVPVGSAHSQPVDVRIVSATHRSLRRAVSTGRFREDLMFRLRVVPIFLPPLRDRIGDVQLLLGRFIGEKNLKGRRIISSVAPDAMRALLEHDWPGNVRELKNVVEYAFAVGRGPELMLNELPPELQTERSKQPGAAKPASQLIPANAIVSATNPASSEELERQRIAQALSSADGHIGKAALALGISRPTLWRKRRKYGL